MELKAASSVPRFLEVHVTFKDWERKVQSRAKSSLVLQCNLILYKFDPGVCGRLKYHILPKLVGQGPCAKFPPMPPPVHSRHPQDEKN